MKLKMMVIGMAALALVAAAQEKKVVQERVMVVTADGGGAGQGNQTVRLMHFDAGPVKGAPYAAEAQNETIQTLADGNRIIEKSSSKMYRDSEGRTRMENNFSTLGALVPEGKAPSITSINDPVSGEHYMLDNNRKTATKMMVPKLDGMGKAGEKKEVRVEVRHAGPGSSGSATGTATATAGRRVERHAAEGGWEMVSHDVMMAGPAVMEFKQMQMQMHHLDGAAGPNVKKESLGKQVIEGVECDGTRETVTIPAGQMGNERALVSVTERWYSEKLKVEVMRKHSDPRFGETNYRLTRIVQAEQPRSLFEIPADYKVESGMGGNVMFNKKLDKVKE